MSFSPWFKVEDNTPDKPEVVAMAAHLRFKDQDLVTGKLIRLWAWANRNSVDGHALSINAAFIDRLTACKGFSAALEAVGWLERGADGLLSFPGFDRHNGDSAKKRASEARKKQNQRGGEPERDKKPGRTGTNVPLSSGQSGGPEIEIDLGERERGRDDSDLIDLVNGCRPEWSAAPAWNPEELAALEKHGPALRGILPATWEAVRGYLAAKLPEGSAGWQPRQRLRFVLTAGDVAAQAAAWKHGAGAGKPAAPEIPAGFVAWAKDRHASTPARVLWLSASMRAEWEASRNPNREDEAA